jgi:acetyl-CoA synthetase
MTAIIDNVPQDAAGISEIGFSVPKRYNASSILFDNLGRGLGGKLAVTGPAGNRTYAALCEDAARFGNGFRSLGLVPGDRVLLFLDDTPAYPAALFGAIRAGLVPLLINTLTPSDLLNFYLVDSRAIVAVVEAEFADRFSASAVAGAQLKTLIVVNGTTALVGSLDVLSANQWLSSHSPRLEAADTGRDDIAFWMYSSGSTGRPKGIVHLQHDMLYTHMSYAKNYLHLTSNDACYSVPKIFFAYGLGNSVTFPFAVGATSVLAPSQPKPGAIFENIGRFRPTVFFGLPTLYTAMTTAPEIHTADIASLRLCVSAAEVLAADVFNRWKAITGLEIMEGLGSTEVLHIYLSNTNTLKKPGAAGRRVEGYEVQLKDASGQEILGDAEGILWVRGDSNSPGYWNRPDKTAETMREDGWIYTGDRFVRDEDGYYFFRGRADDLIKVSGQWVYPLEVELCLADHPDVRECAVMGIELEDRRMTLKAFVVMKEAVVSEAAVTKTLQEYVKRALLPYKYPRDIEFCLELPKTGTGKIDRQALLTKRT